MNPSAFVVTLIGTIASFFVILGNLFLLYSTRKKKNELVLFYFRFFIDVVFGLSYFLYSFFILGFTIYESSFFIPNYYLFWLGLPFSNASAARNFLILLIVLDRLLATCFPILYHNIRPRVSNLMLFFLPVLFTGVENFVIFIICGKYSKTIKPTCVSFPCTLNSCGYFWWTSYKSVIFPIIIILTVVLCIKLFVFSKKLQDSSATKRANRLALLDAFLIFIFDCIPSLLAYQFPNSPLIEYTSTGPVTAMLKQVGRAIESFIVIDILVRRMRVDGSRRKSSQVVIIGPKNSK